MFGALIRQSYASFESNYFAYCLQKSNIMISSDQSHSDRRVLLEKWEENAKYLCKKNVEYGSALDSA